VGPARGRASAVQASREKMVKDGKTVATASNRMEAVVLTPATTVRAPVASSYNAPFALGVALATGMGGDSDPSVDCSETQRKWKVFCWADGEWDLHLR
jgi:hypothetical protein